MNDKKLQSLCAAQAYIDVVRTALRLAQGAAQSVGEEAFADVVVRLRAMARKAGLQLESRMEQIGSGQADAPAMLVTPARFVLWEYLAENHGVHLLDSEMDELAGMVREMDAENKKESGE